jgi:hypothetical protein
VGLDIDIIIAAEEVQKISWWSGTIEAKKGELITFTGPAPSLLVVSLGQ